MSRDLRKDDPGGAASDPQRLAILMTGYAHPDVDYELEAEPLSKPFDVPTLLRVLTDRLFR